ncbi:MAG TPA: hypothetical protein PKW08_04780 [Flavobacteriaceae bacterium]|nr:hypothetical protein [Flavobacteriaceae bacterium]HPF10601.1 hypothetical protein [Flavobacteriaceae bacterium]HQU20883.1 hypothetical protein [Flavobacteriaceae bacterium]HQU64367.1 hypothetical protein [Flavobacteriaceae bacterium]HRW43284.1 hypothetical protein [Flavobacteriaceae bacterium]
MKTLKNVMLAGLFAMTMNSYANNVPVFDIDGNVTISQEADKVQVSILNTANVTYQLIIYSEDGTLVYKGWLGNAVSLGRAFDFQTAQKGTYTFKLISKEGALFEQDVKIG